MKTLYAILLLAFAVNANAQTQSIPGWDAMGRPIRVNIPTVAPSSPATTINGLSGNINLVGGIVDPGTNSIFIPSNVSGEEYRGTSVQSNTTLTGTLTVLKDCFLNTASGQTVLGRASAHNPGILIFVDTNGGSDSIVTEQDGANYKYTIPDAGGNASFVMLVSAPVNSTDSGTTGNVAYDGSYWYVCTAPNTWVRTALATW